ncbi:MAG: membrane protein insertion efficiency factor YidD [Bacteroidetes bacterium]|nr:membrane protein insertion efficiency factor YidD [Bacteroidota bacterium]
MVRALMIFFIRMYQVLLSPLLGSNCRFQPTCSAYAKESITVHGPWRGGWLAIRRISKCHPWNEPAYDPVPAKSAKSSKKE